MTDKWLDISDVLFGLTMIGLFIYDFQNQNEFHMVADVLILAFYTICLIEIRCSED